MRNGHDAALVAERRQAGAGRRGNWRRIPVPRRAAEPAEAEARGRVRQIEHEAAVPPGRGTGRRHDRRRHRRRLAADEHPAAPRHNGAAAERPRGGKPGAQFAVQPLDALEAGRILAAGNSCQHRRERAQAHFRFAPRPRAAGSSHANPAG